MEFLQNKTLFFNWAGMEEEVLRPMELLVCVGLYIHISPGELA